MGKQTLHGRDISNFGIVDDFQSAVAYLAEKHPNANHQTVTVEMPYAMQQQASWLMKLWGCNLRFYTDKEHPANWFVFYADRNGIEILEIVNQ